MVISTKAHHPLTYFSFLCIFFFSVSGCSTSSNYLERGRASAERGDWEESAKIFTEANQKHPGDKEIRLMLSRSRWEASKAHRLRGKKLFAANQFNEAIKEYQLAIAYDPANHMAAEQIRLTRARQEAFHLIKNGQVSMKIGKYTHALEAFKAANKLDPGNKIALKYLNYFRKRENERPKLPIQLKSRTPVSLKFKQTPILNVFEALTKISGINFIFDAEMADSKVTLFMTDVPLDHFIEMLLQTNKLAAKVVNNNTMVIYPDTPSKAKEYRDLQIRTIYLLHLDAKKAVSMVSRILHSKNIIANDQLNTVIIRGSLEEVELAGKIIEANDRAPAEVMLNVEIMEVSRDKTMNLGIQFSESITLGMGPGSDRRASTSNRSTTSTRTRDNKTDNILGTTRSDGTVTTSTSSLSSGKVITNEDGSRTVTGLASGITSFGAEVAKTISAFDLTKLSTKELIMSLPSATVNLIKSDRDTRFLANPQLRVKSREKASIHVGERVPLRVNRRVDSETGDITSDFQYQDVGIKLQAEPIININDDITLKLSIEVSALGNEIGPANDPQPVIQTRTTKSVVTLRDGEAVIIGGLIRDDERTTVQRVPLLGDIPLVGELFSNHNTETNKKTEILMAITPYMVHSQGLPDPEISNIWSGSGKSFSLSEPFESVASESSSYTNRPSEAYIDDKMKPVKVNPNQTSPPKSDVINMMPKGKATGLPSMNSPAGPSSFPVIKGPSPFPGGSAPKAPPGSADEIMAPNKGNGNVPSIDSPVDYPLPGQSPQ